MMPCCGEKREIERLKDLHVFHQGSASLIELCLLRGTSGL